MIRLTIFKGDIGFEKVSVNPAHVVSIEYYWSDDHQKGFFVYLMSTGKEYNCEESPGQFERLIEQQLEGEQ